MANYISDLDIEDEILQGTLLDSDFDAATSAVNEVADELGIAVADIKTPISGKVKEYAISVACARRAKLTIGSGTRASQEGSDVYTVKYQVYRKEAEMLRLSITPKMITGNSDAGKYSPSIELFRT